MVIQGYITLVVFGLTLVGLISFQRRPAAVLGCTMLVLVAGNFVSRDQFLNSLVNPGLVTLLLLFLCSLALEKTRLLHWIASRVIVKSYRHTWLRLFGITALSSALLNNTAIVATLLSPVRNNPHHRGSQLLLPLSYAAILGGTLTLIGTSTNLIVNSLMIDTSGYSLSFFSFTAVGAILLITCGTTLYFCRGFLPLREPQKQAYKGYFIDAKVEAESELIGQSVESAGLRHLESLFLVEIVREGRLITPVAPTEVIQAKDRLVFSGDVNKLMQISQFSGLKLFADSNGLLSRNLTEVIIRPESVLIGKTLKSCGFRALFDAAVVAIRRDGEQVSGKLGDAVLKAGDFLVLAVGEDFHNRHNIGKNFVLASGMSPERRVSGWSAWLAVGGFVSAVVLAAAGVVDLLRALVVLLGGLVLTRTLEPQELVRRFPVDIWLIVASALMLSQALENTGVVTAFSGWMQHSVLGGNYYIALIAIYVTTWLMTELVTNNAAAALMFPIAYATALGLNVDIMPFVMTVAFAASASFISPYGYQTNLMVYNAGQYRISDFIRVGAPVSLVYACVTLICVPIFFPFFRCCFN